MNEISEERIRESLNEIEIPAGAKERMLANIRRKAADQTCPEEYRSGNPEGPVKMPSKRIIKWALPIAACFAAVVIGTVIMPKIIHSPKPGNNLEIANPFVSVENASRFEEVLGITADAPEGAENVQYRILDARIADVLFDMKAHSFTLRASKVRGDFSGLYGTEERTELIDSESSAVLTVIRCGDELYRKVTWTDGKTVFILSNTDGASDEEIAAVYGKMK